MPQIDVSFVTMDPMVADRFDVVRRAESVGANGRTTMTQQNLPNQIGVVAAVDPADLVRQDDGQYVPRSISINTTFALRGAALGVQPDLVVYDGVTYMVETARSYQRFGSGFTSAVAKSVAAQDPPL